MPRSAAMARLWPGFEARGQDSRLANALEGLAVTSSHDHHPAVTIGRRLLRERKDPHPEKYPEDEQHPEDHYEHLHLTIPSAL
jgi:hypothetical protein